MNRQQRFFLVICGFFLAGALALWPGIASPYANANVTLVSFTGATLPGQPEVYIEWETATEFDTVGFFIMRGDSFNGTFTEVSDFIPHEGDTVVGAQYDWVDEDTVLNRVYLYRLEEITSAQQRVPYGPITVTTGTLVSVEPSVTPSRTPTTTPSRTATTQSNTTTVANSTASSGSVVVATPRVITGATVTPRPTSSGGSSGAVVAATPVVNEPDSPQQPQTVATSVPDAVVATVAPPGFTVGEVAQAPDPTRVPTDAAPAIVAPAIVVTEAAPAATGTTASTNASALLLVAAAFLFLGIAFFIFRQVRQ